VSAMRREEAVRRFYLENLPDNRWEEDHLEAPCPFCAADASDPKGMLRVDLHPESPFMGYYRCTRRCSPGGFPLFFAKMRGLDPASVPGFDPDREPFVRDTILSTKNINLEITRFQALMGESQYAHFERYGISRPLVKQMEIGYNGRYLLFPYFLEDNNCYAARCVLPERADDAFWHGDAAYTEGDFRIYNAREIERCEGGTLFITDGEINLLTLMQLGYPGIAVPHAGDLEVITPERLAHIERIFLIVNHSPEAHQAARTLAVRLGYKSRILEWPFHRKRGYHLNHLARETGVNFGRAVERMIRESRAFSPFSSPEKEHRLLISFLEREKGKTLLGIPTGFEKLDRALNGLRGINILGGPPKAGKSCFFMQISTEVATNSIPVIYYDFENGRQKIYTRTLCRLSRLSEKEIRLDQLDDAKQMRLDSAKERIQTILPFFRVVTDRKLGPDLMKRKIDFLQHETGCDFTLVVIDSLHKLPFKNLSERRTGIDEWLRNMESMRDEQNVTFLVTSELSRGEGGRYDRTPDMAAFKESGDIEYSADNAMILMPDWDPLDPISEKERQNTLFLVASRENNPGKVADYMLEYPLWGFREV